METKTIKATEVQKELMIKKVEANFSHYTAGNMYYTVELVNSVPMGTYQFPINTVETDYIEGEEPGDDERPVLILSQDIGTTTFSNKMKGSELNRWIKKAIEEGDFIKIS